MKKVQKKKSSLQKKNGSAPKSEISMLADEMRAGFEMVNKKMDDGCDGLSNRIDDLSKK